MNKSILQLSDLEEGFREIGLYEGIMVEVHSSLSSFGKVEGGAETVIRALMNVVTSRGAIIMTTFPMSVKLQLTDEDKRLGILSKVQYFDESSDEPSGMGIIADTFRKHEGVITGSGLHRVSAWGKDAEKNSESLCNLIDNDGHALLLGVDIYSLTSMHYMESKLPSQISDIFETPLALKELYPPDKWFIVTKLPPVKAWYTIQDEAMQRKLITEKLIGKSRCMFFKVNDVIRIYERALETDPFGLYGIPQS